MSGTSRQDEERVRTEVDAGALMSERFLVQAGIRPRMRVLDVGCGRGGVSILVARLVGEQGEVVGIDREPRVLAAARESIERHGLVNVKFVEGDFARLGEELGLFDAAVGRRVLMYQDDPVEAIRCLARAVRPGGLIMFEEVDSTIRSTSLVPLPLHEQVQGWIWETLERSGARIHMGFDFYSVLDEAGLSASEVRAEALVQTPRTGHPTAPVIRGLLARMLEHGIATEAEVDLDTLERRLLEERREAGATFIGQMVFAAWARKAG